MAALSTIAAIAGIGAAGVSLLGSRKRPTAPPPSLLAPMPDPANDPTQIAQRNRLGARRRAAGSLYTPPPTLLTGPGGLSAPADTQRATLLGR